MKFRIKALAAMFAITFLAGSIFGQIEVESWRGKTVEVDGDLVTLNTDDKLLDYCYSLAYESTLDSRGIPAKTATLLFAEKSYRFYQRISGSNVHKKFHAAICCKSKGIGRRPTRWIFYNVVSDDILVLYSNGYGGAFEGIDFRTASYKNAHNVTALHLESVSPFTVDQVDMTLNTTLGDQCNGIVIARKSGSNLNTESLVVSNCNIRATNPINVVSGDNIRIENQDLRCFGGVAPIQGQVADNLVLSQITGQGGRHMLYFVRGPEKPKVNSGLAVYDYRFEQTEIPVPNEEAAIVVKMWRDTGTGHGLEYLNLIGCRFSPNKHKYDVELKGIISTTTVGGYLPGGPKPEPELEPVNQ